MVSSGKQYAVGRICMFSLQALPEETRYLPTLPKPKLYFWAVVTLCQHSIQLVFGLLVYLWVRGYDKYGLYLVLECTAETVYHSHAVSY